MKEAHIRPQALFDEYLALCRHDAETFFTADEWEETACPACSGDGPVAFTKHGFRYRECDRCQTLYASPRPTYPALGRYYREAESVRFWATDFYRETEAARRELMFRPRAENAVAAARARSVRPLGVVVDIGAGYGVFCEEVRRVAAGAVVVAVEPSPALAGVCRGKGLRVVQRFLEELDPSDLPPVSGGARLFTSFELFEHLHTPRRFLDACRRLMAAGDVLVLTTLSGTGLDIQVLWQEAKAVFPPHHLNFLNPRALERLARDCGFQNITVTTPGRLDVDIMCNSISRVTDHRFMTTLVRHATSEAREALQAWLAAHGFSSHMMMVAQVDGAPEG